MAKNRFTMLPKQMGLSMSPSYSHTVSVATGPSSPDDDDDDGDICPVCDGECTCNSTKLPLRPPTPPVAPRASGPLSMAELSRQYNVATSPSTPILPAAKQPKKLPPPPSYPTLKIKVAIPHSMLAKRQGAPESSGSSSHRKLKNADEMTSVYGSAGENFAYIGPSSGAATPTPSYPFPHTTQPSTAPRKRGRPRKVIPPAARDSSVDSSRRVSTSPVHKRSNPKTNIIGRQKQHIYAQKYARTLKARPSVSSALKPKPSLKSVLKKKTSLSKRRRQIDSDSSLSDLSDDGDYGGRSTILGADSDECDIPAGDFPTFVSASALSSLNSTADGNSSDSSSLSGFESDLSLVQEEEDFILSEMQGKAHREGGERRREQKNEWVIKPRRNSAGYSDAEIEVDSDATEEDDEDEEEIQNAQADAEGQDEEDGDETDGRLASAQDFKGLVTSWSADEESSFDADVFFANLSTDSASGSSDDEAKESAGMRFMDDDDETSSDVSTEAELMHMREELENLPLELAENWDGQMVFTNGSLGGQALIDIDFEVNASQFVADSETTCCKNVQCGSSLHDHYMAQDGRGSDVEMSDVDDEGYEEDAGEGEGDTTDEELVGEDDLPNERAMRLFNFPLSVSAINPLSTVSPAVTPASKRPGLRMSTTSNRLESPSPADILSGKVGWDSADEMDELFDSEQRGRRIVRGDRCQSERDSVRLGPRKGVFTPVQEARQVVIDDSHKEIPSPHPIFNRRRGRRLNTVEALLRKHLFVASKHPNNLVPAATAVPNNSPLKLLPSVEITANASSASSLLVSGNHREDDSLTAPIDLDDVFESSFFNPDPNDPPTNTVNRSGGSASAPPDSPPDESDSNRDEMKHLHRWDVISVGAFRHTRENGASTGIHDSPGPSGWPSDHRRSPASSTDYGNVLKASPLSTMLWPTSDKNKRGSRRNLAVGAPSALGASPLIMPTRSDGDRTPTKYGRHQQQQQQQQQNNYAPKTRKELRKERKSSKKKAYGHSPHHHHPSHQYHSHHHHPNTKSRSSGSSQRTNFFLSSVPPLNI